MMMTMMMIVDLYSALRRAPLLRYVSRCIVKRNVFSADRKDLMLSEIASHCMLVHHVMAVYYMSITRNARRASHTRAQIHRYCLKIYPKICHKIILRQKL